MVDRFRFECSSRELLMGPGYLWIWDEVLVKWVFGGCFLRSFHRDYYLDFVNWCQLLQIMKIFNSGSRINHYWIFYVDLDYWLKDYYWRNKLIGKSQKEYIIISVQISLCSIKIFHWLRESLDKFFTCN